MNKEDYHGDERGYLGNLIFFHSAEDLKRLNDPTHQELLEDVEDVWVRPYVNIPPEMLEDATRLADFLERAFPLGTTIDYIVEKDFEELGLASLKHLEPLGFNEDLKRSGFAALIHDPSSMVQVSIFPYQGVLSVTYPVPKNLTLELQTMIQKRVNKIDDAMSVFNPQPREYE